MIIIFWLSRRSFISFVLRIFKTPIPAIFISISSQYFSVSNRLLFLCFQASYSLASMPHNVSNICYRYILLIEIHAILWSIKWCSWRWYTRHGHVDIHSIAMRPAVLIMARDYRYGISPNLIICFRYLLSYTHWAAISLYLSAKSRHIFTIGINFGLGVFGGQLLSAAAYDGLYDHGSALCFGHQSHTASVRALTILFLDECIIFSLILKAIVELWNEAAISKEMTYLGHAEMYAFH